MVPFYSGGTVSSLSKRNVSAQIRISGYVLNDNAEPDFLEFIRDSANGFISVNLPLKSGTELCVEVS
jgi:hypothetical protein